MTADTTPRDTAVKGWLRGIRRSRPPRRVMLGGAIAVPCALALFATGQATAPHPAWHVGVGLSSAEDVACNVALFIPFGLAASAFFAGGVAVRQRLLLVAGTAALFSLSIEMIQTLIPSRFPSMVDVAANTIGAAVGCSAYELWQSHRRGLLLALYTACVCVFSLLLVRTARLAEWDRTFPLVIGNEANGERLWSGSVWRVEIADRAAGRTAIHSLLTRSEPDGADTFARIMRDSVVASYDFGAVSSCRDSSGHLPTLVWNNGGECVGTASGVRLGYQGWLHTRLAAGGLTDRITATNQFTLTTSVEPANNWQTGPARIVSLSADADRRNFTLGQRGADFIVRVRNRLNGRNGSQFELVAPAAVRPGSQQQVAVTYDGSRLSIFVDDPEPRASLEMGPGLALAAQAVPRSLLARVARAVPLDPLYFAAVFLGFGLLAALAPRSGSADLPLRSSLLMVFIAANPLMLEIVLHFATGRAVEPARPLIGLASLLVPFVGFSTAAVRLTPGVAPCGK
jgi:hypothetical protein